MAGATGKLREWGRYEYGRCIGNLPGNCGACEKAHASLKKETPCERCPKYLLYPDPHWRGLEPKNSMAVELYNLAARDQRVGMDATLIGTITAADANAVIDLYSEHLPHEHARRRTFEKMLVLDRTVTKTRSEIENKEREEAMNRAKADAKRRGR